MATENTSQQNWAFTQDICSVRQCSFTSTERASGRTARVFSFCSWAQEFLWCWGFLWQSETDLVKKLLDSNTYPAPLINVINYVFIGSQSVRETFSPFFRLPNTFFPLCDWVISELLNCHSRPELHLRWLCSSHKRGNMKVELLSCSAVSTLFLQFL